jgi:site-specific DNA recombinase
VQAVIIYKLDRLSRNTDDYSSIRMLMRRHNVEIKSVTENFENTPSGRFMENIIATVAQFDRRYRFFSAIGK